MAFDEDMVRKVWEKGGITEKADPEIWRKDECGAWIRRNFFENLNSQFGWEIDLIVPEFEGGANDLWNLRPLQWRNRISKRAGRLVCPITAREWYNVPR